jgi:hypothetical protein
MKRLLITITMATVLFTTGCNSPRNSTDRAQAAQTERMVEAANNSVGMPNIVNFVEKRFAKFLVELRDQEISTFSYYMDMHGGLHFLCNSIGYGIPASVQYVNPARTIRHSYGNTTLPQPEPNGLFMPEGLAATYVLCSDDVGGVKPVYFEPELIVSPFKLKSVGGE